MSTNILALEVHSKFRGDAEKTVKKLDKKKLSGEVKNKEYIPRLEFIKTKDLVPMETQRDVKSTWVVERQERLEGLDMLALGVLSVACDPNDGKNYVWDGCGRWAIVDTNGGIDTVPCVVYDMTKEKAAFYFAYNQEEGRRKLSREVTFVNAFVGGDEEAAIWASRLDLIGCYIKSSEDYIVNSDAKNNGYPEILYRALTEGHKIAKGDISVQRQARDMIVNAWSTTDSGCERIVTEIYWALIKLMVSIPETRKNGLNGSIQKYLNWLAEGTTQGGVAKEWKGSETKGLSGNVGVASILAHSFAKKFVNSSYGAKHRNTIVLSKILPKKQEEDNDE
jgi:hypothetical protein